MTTPASTPSRQLSLFDSTNIIVGIIIGVGIYQMAPGIASGVGSISDWIAGMVPTLSPETCHRLAVLILWVTGGLISLFGALGYAELATKFPLAGGDYVYLSRAYGQWAGFLFGWVQLSIVRPGDIAVMAFAFATYALRTVNPGADATKSTEGLLLACGAVVFLTAIHILGVRQGKWTQNLLTVAKAVGLLVIAIVAFTANEAPAAPAPNFQLPLATALVLVLFTYGGWNEMAYVAAEVKDPSRNIVRALVLGTCAVIGLYIILNAAFLHVLGYNGLVGSKAVAADVVASVLPSWSAAAISILICISALGAVNGLIFTGARISYALGQEHPTFRPLGLWNSKTGTPIWALLVQGLIAMAMIILFHSFIDTLIYTAIAVYGFYLASNLAVIVLRFREFAAVRSYQIPFFLFATFVFYGSFGYSLYKWIDSGHWINPGLLVFSCLCVVTNIPIIILFCFNHSPNRSYRVTGYPFTTLVFCDICGYLVYNCVNFARENKPNSLKVMAGTFLIGVVLLIADVAIRRVRQKLSESK